MPIGAGFSPFGTSLVGYGSVDVAAGPLTTIYIDSTNGVAMNARKIDSRLRQYVYNANGRVQGMSGIYQRVQLAVQTVRGQSALGAAFGMAPAPAVKVANYQKQIEASLRQALNDLVTQKLITITGVTVKDAAPNNPTGAYAMLTWIDNTSGVEQQTRL